MKPEITQEDIDWVQSAIGDWVAQLTGHMQEYRRTQVNDLRNVIRYDCHAIEYILADVKKCMQYGHPIPKVLTKE